MQDGMSAEVSGLADLAVAMDGLPRRVARAAVKPALSAAGQVMVAGLETTVPHGETGALAGSLDYKVSTSADLSRLTVVAGPKYAGAGTQDPGVYGKFVEKGTRKMAPRFWIARAFEAIKGTAADAAIEVLRSVLGNIPK